MAIHTTACPRNCYSTCGMQVEVEDGRLRRILPEPGNRATAEGPCLKGLSYLERVCSPDRILYPLRRSRDHGPQALLYYSASATKGLLNGIGARFWRAFGGYTSTYGDLCWSAGLEATRLTLGENKHNVPRDIAHAGLVILWGKNPAETNIHQMPFIEEARRNGAGMIVVDPRRTRSSERADLLVQLRPGTDLALALALAHIIIRDGRVDAEFITRHVNGYEEFAAAVKSCTAEWAAAICGFASNFIEEMAETITTSGPVSLCAGFGMQRYTNSGQTMRALIALLAITGNIGKPGAGWIFANLQTDIFGAVKDPVAFYPPEQNDGVARISIATAELGPGLAAQQNPPLKMAWVERGNPLSQNPRTGLVREAFAALDFRVVVEQTMSDTAAMADIILPAKSLFEQSDIIGAYWHSYLQWKPALINPPGEVRPESEIYRALGPLLGITDFELAGMLPEPGEAGVQAWLENHLAKFPGLDLSDLKTGPQPAPGLEEIAFADLRFPTPSGKIELLSAEATERWKVDSLPHWTVPEAFTRKRPEELYLLTPNTQDRIHSQFHDLKMIPVRDQEPRLQIHPADAHARHLTQDQKVRIFNARGEIVIPITLENRLRPGCVALHNGWQERHGAAVNLLSPARNTDMGYGAAFHDTLVQVAAVEERR